MTNSLRLNNQNQNSLRVWELIGAGGGGEGGNTVTVSLSAKKSDGTNFPAGVYEKGVNYDDVVFSMKVTPLKPSESPVTSAKLYKDNTAVQTFTPSSSAVTYTYTADVTDTCTYKGEAKTAKQTAVSNLKYTFVDPMFYGACDVTPTAAEIVNLTKLVKAKGKTTCNYTSNARVCFCYPKEYGALTSILDDMKFEYIYAFEQTEATLSLHGDSVDYYVYTTIDEAMIDDFNYTFIF